MYVSAKKIQVLADWSKIAQKNMTVRNSAPMRREDLASSAPGRRPSPPAVTTLYLTGMPVTVTARRGSCSPGPDHLPLDHLLRVEPLPEREDEQGHAPSARPGTGTRSGSRSSSRSHGMLNCDSAAPMLIDM